MKNLKKGHLPMKHLRRYLIFIQQKNQTAAQKIEQVRQKERQALKKKLRENLNINEKVLVLAERIKKKSAAGKFYKQSVINIVHFK